jgi:hypothetical protein
MDPKKLLDRLPRLDPRDKPFRYLGRRIIQAMVEAATSNLVLGQRSAPGRYLVIHLAENARDKEQWEQQWSEARPAILKELERETQVRDIRPRSTLEIDLLVLTDEEAGRGEAERALSTVLDETEAAPALKRLDEEREIVLARRVRTLTLESDPPDAQAYVDNRPVGVTPCRVDDIPEGEHTISFSRRGYLLYETRIRVTPGRPGQRLIISGSLEPEPEMGVLEVRTFPPRAAVAINGETRDSTARWRLPAGPVEIRVSLPDYEAKTFRTYLPPTPEDRVHRVQVRLNYAGAQAEEVVGRLIVYKPGTAAVEPPPQAGSAEIRSFFRNVDEPDDEWDVSYASPSAAPPPPPVILGEKPVTRGVLLIGREDPEGELQPDVRLFDPENSVSRGCHAWIWVYADRSTGADYNTFLIGNNSPAGIRVDGQTVMETRRLSDDSIIEVGNFRMRVVKETPSAHVEFG